MTSLATASPKSDTEQLMTVARLVAQGEVVVLTGAGLSTDSGIPDYRSPGTTPRQPMTHGEFLSGPAARQRYWARSHLGWQRMRQADPNPGHLAIARLGQAGVVTSVITQNVDGLHGVAGSRPVIDLHGRIDEVVCVDCGQVSPRLDLQIRMSALNPGFGDDLDLVVAPDGDVEFEDTDDFRVPACLRCAGVLKPRVVFFGDSVPKPTVAECYERVDAARTLLVAGSSLTVMSGLRFVRRAARNETPIVIINRGITRGDELAQVKLEAGCSESLAGIADAVGA